MKDRILHFIVSFIIGVYALVTFLGEGDIRIATSLALMWISIIFFGKGIGK